MMDLFIPKHSQVTINIYDYVMANVMTFVLLVTICFVALLVVKRAGYLLLVRYKHAFLLVLAFVGVDWLFGLNVVLVLRDLIVAKL